MSAEKDTKQSKSPDPEQAASLPERRGLRKLRCKWLKRLVEYGDNLESERNSKADVRVFGSAIEEIAEFLLDLELEEEAPESVAGNLRSDSGNAEDRPLAGSKEP